MSPDVPRRALPARPSLEHLRKEAKDRLRAARRDGESATLAHTQFTLAREYGFASWPELVRHVESIAGGFTLRPLIRPSEMVPGQTRTLDDGSVVTTDDIYAMFAASRDGDFSAVKRLVARAPGLATREYNYTPPIHFSVREGHRDITEFLLDHGADPAYRSYPFSEALLTFAEDRGHESVADLLKSRLTKRFVVAPKTEAIIAAADRGDVAAIAAELARDPSLARAGNETGDTALHHAAKHEHLDAVRALIAAGADVDAVRGDGSRPIHGALMPNWFFLPTRERGREIARLLLAHGARYNVFVATLFGDDDFVRGEVSRDRSLANFEDTNHERVLSAAVRRRNVALTRFLLDAGADPTLPELGAPRGYSMWIAVNDGEREILEMLLAKGGDPNGDIDSCGTPMTQARAKKDEAMLRLLRRHGGHDDRSPEKERVWEFVKAGRLDEAERILRDHPDWVTGTEAGWGDGIMAGPANEGRNDIIEMLVRRGATVPKVSKWAPYYYFKHFDTAKLLLERGMDPNHMNWHRFTLLHHMAAEGEIAKATLLLDHGADIDAIDDEYRSTPLGVAARRGQLEMVRLLLERGADPGLSGAPWSVPLVWAERKGHVACAQLLRAIPGH